MWFEELKISFVSEFQGNLRLDSPSCDVHLAAVDFLLRLGACEEAVVDHEVVHLRNLLSQCVMLLQETEQLLGRTVNGELLGQKVLDFKHVFEENLAETTALPRFVDVKVKHAGSMNVTSFPELIKDVEWFAANFEETNDQSAINFRVENKRTSERGRKGETTQRQIQNKKQ